MPVMRADAGIADKALQGWRKLKKFYLGPRAKLLREVLCGIAWIFPAQRRNTFHRLDKDKAKPKGRWRVMELASVSRA